MPIISNTFKIIASKDDPDPVAMYIIVRKQLQLSAPKLAVQVGHVVQLLMIHHYDANSYKDGTDRIIEKWMSQAFRKILLGASDKEFEKIKEEEYGFLIVDAGLTEIEHGTETVFGLIPMHKSERPKTIKKLQLLK